jgi:hypothetical protein
MIQVVNPDTDFLPIPDPSVINRVVDPGPEPDPYWTRIQLGLWIRIRIRNPDPDPGGQK